MLLQNNHLFDTLYIAMKKDIHPKYYNNSKVVCACGNTFTTGSTQSEIRTEICSACHPFYTGKQKLIDNQGRIERFQRMVSKKKKSVTKKPKAKKSDKSS